MKNSLIVLFALIFISAAKLTFSQDTSIVKYFPLQVGNVWVYNCSSFGSGCSCSIRTRIKAASTVMLNNKLFFILQYSNVSYNCIVGGCTSYLVSFDTLRVDSLTGNIYKYSLSFGCSYTPFEIMLDSLRAHIGDTIHNNCGIHVNNFSYKCIDTLQQNIFGTLRPTRTYRQDMFESYFNRKYAKGIGVYSTNGGGISCSSNSILQGCVIDGVLYGDTSMLVGITPVGNNIPESCCLYQNYPNPFNPKTVIRFQVARDKFVTLKIYDALGKEVATLINEQLSPGTYEADWDGANYPSGVYFYQLSVGNEQLATKKMVLMK